MLRIVLPDGYLPILGIDVRISTCQVDRSLPNFSILPMPFSSAMFPHNEQRVLDDIDRQFRPSVDKLVNLTKEFLVEFKLGLESYGQPMAMMHVSSIVHVQSH